MATYINLTPHAIVLNDGRIFAPSGVVARVTTSFTDIIDDVCEVVYGEVENLPEPKEGTRYIVSAMVLGPAKAATMLSRPQQAIPKPSAMIRGTSYQCPVSCGPNQPSPCLDNGV